MTVRNYRWKVNVFGCGTTIEVLATTGARAKRVARRVAARQLGIPISWTTVLYAQRCEIVDAGQRLDLPDAALPQD